MAIFFGSFHGDLLAFGVTLVFLVVAYFKYAFTYWSRKGVDDADPTIPFGNVKPLILQQLHMGENILNLYKKYKKPGRRFVGTYFFTKPELLLLDAEMVKHVMIKDFHHFEDRALTYDEENDPLSAHLLSLDGEKWRTMRQKLTPTFTSGKIKMMYQTILDCSEDLESVLDETVDKEEAIDIKEIVARFTTDIIGSCAFGLECNSLKDPEAEFRKFGKKVFEPSVFLWTKKLLGLVFPRVLKFFKIAKTDAEVNDFFISAVNNTVKYREENNVTRNDFLQLLINIKNTGDVDKEKGKGKYGNNLTMNQIAAQSFLFFLAGFETSSTTMTFFLYDVANHQDIQDKVRNEINEVLSQYDGKITYEAITKMQYLDRVLNESIRIHSSIPVLLRRCTKRYKIPDTEIFLEKGTTVVIPVCGLQSDPDYYPDPEKFNPERFTEEEISKRPTCAFLPFGAGPRNCIGLRFGTLQTKVGIIVLLRNHKFTVSDRTKVPLEMDKRSFIYSVTGGIWLNAERI